MILLAIICDLYNPLLLLLSVYSFFKVKEKWQSVALFLWVIVVAYGLMFVDAKLHFWKFLSLDYSTHTATAVGMIVFIHALIRIQFLTFILAFSLVLYAILMKSLGYHGFMDVISTVVVVVPLMLIGFRVTKTALLKCYLR